MEKSKIIDKIQKCLRLSQSGNANESALALKQAQALMRKYGIAEAEVKDTSVAEATASSAGYYNPPYWAIALSELVARAFDCRAYVSQCEQGPEFRFIGAGASAEVSAYTFTVLFRQLRYARRQYLHELEMADTLERSRRGNVFAQAWLYRIAQTVAEFVTDPDVEAVIDAYVQERYGEPLASERSPASIDTKDYEIIMSGMKAADHVLLCRPMSADKGSEVLLEDVNCA
jgi:hypothetical protein